MTVWDLIGRIGSMLHPPHGDVSEYVVVVDVQEGKVYRVTGIRWDHDAKGLIIEA